MVEIYGSPFPLASVFSVKVKKVRSSESKDAGGVGGLMKERGEIMI